MSSRTPLFAKFSILACLCAYTQTTDATVSGSVADPSGAIVPGAAVVATNTKTGAISRVTANGTGVYLFPALQPGVYQLSAEHTGFKKYVLDDIDLNVAANLNINLRLEVGLATETVEVKSSSGETELGYATNSVGSVVSGRKVLDLPLQSRNAYDLIATQAGTSITFQNGGLNFNGARIGAVNFTLDGTNVQDNLLNGIVFAVAAASVSSDRIEEFRIITSPADAELGRGSGQIQAITRSGTNQFHGSLFEENRNTYLTANTWFNNQRGAPRDRLNRNQYGGRVGGPILKNKTFFHFNYEGQKEREGILVNSTAYTATARQGLWRFFPGSQNQNANGVAPSVDLSGNPVQPATATGPLQTVSVFGRDPNRLVADPSGTVAKQLSFMPLPNNFRAGDGLNTAGYTWTRSRNTDFGQWDLRFDHQISSNHRASFSYSHQASTSSNYIETQAYPSVPPGQTPNGTNIFSLTVNSILRPNLLNEFHAGVFRPAQTYIGAGQDTPGVYLGQAGFFGRSNNFPYILAFGGGVTSPFNPGTGDDPSFRISPVYQYSNNVTWLKGKHAFKGGAEVRFISALGYDTIDVVPRVALGAQQAVPVQNIRTIPGIGVNTGAEGLLSDLSGSIRQIATTINSQGGMNPAFIPGLNRYQHLRAPEFSWFFKDDYKLRPDLTLNLGIRYEWYSVPQEIEGKGLTPLGGGNAVFGPSGTSFAAEFTPGASGGSITVLQPIGPRTANPNGRYYNNDNNNFAPAVGLSWSLPWFGKDKTVFRMGYGMGYEHTPLYTFTILSGTEPGYSNLNIFQPGTLVTASTLSLPIPPTAQPLQPIPLTDRNSIVYGFDPKLRTPYYQNWNISIQRSLARNFLLDVRYVGSKGSKLIQGININEANIFENGILNAFKITQAGGNAPLFDRLFVGLPGVDGKTVTGSDFVRSNSSGLNGFLSGNDPSGFATAISSQPLPGGKPGDILRRAGLPENFVFVSPQFGPAIRMGNYGNSTYNSLQVELVKRFSRGWTFQGNYTWSKALGQYEGDGATLDANVRTLRNLSLDKRVLNFSRDHVVRMNGIYEFPFGPGKKFLNGNNAILSRLLGGWQIGSIATIATGQPIGIGAQDAYNNFGGGTPLSLVPLSKNLGSLIKTGNGVVYFSGLKQVPDPLISTITTVNGIQGRVTLKAIADSSGNLILENPPAGVFGTLAPNFLRGPGFFNVDVDLLKRIRIVEGKELVLRMDVISATNSPIFSNPNTNINDPNFGRITSVNGTQGGNRIVVIGLRFNF
ncbi:MAG: carboxypeptidase regulatory-like domain-containing protein [Bryobacteraceae bacterium]